jgi:glutathione S-transferase
MLLYDSPTSGNCYKVRLLLAQLGVPYTRRELSTADKSNRAEVLGGLNPALRVPTLILDDGRPLGESNAILWYLAEGTRYIPEDRYERAQVLQWQFFEQYDHEPNIAVARHWLRSGRAVEPARLAARQAAGRRALEAMDKHLASRKFLVGERYTVADISLYAYTHVAGEGGFDLDPYPAIRAWLDRVASQPGHVPIL